MGHAAIFSDSITLPVIKYLEGSSLKQLIKT
jgi:hypothetical protein